MFPREMLSLSTADGASGRQVVGARGCTRRCVYMCVCTCMCFAVVSLCRSRFATGGPCVRVHMRVSDLVDRVCV